MCGVTVAVQPLRETKPGRKTVEVLWHTWSVTPRAWTARLPLPCATRKRMRAWGLIAGRHGLRVGPVADEVADMWSALCGD